ncbi:MAG: 5-dehydro-2-deoxygluconokinase [Bryocella sp.]
MSNMDAVILGRIGYDLYADEKEQHVPLEQVRTFSRYLGGSSANMAVGLSRLGAKVGIISALGSDSLSQFLTGFLQKEGVNTSHVQTAPGFLPSLCLTEVSPPDSFPQVFYRHDAVDTKLDATEDDLAFAATGRMFITNGTSFCASPSRESTYRAMERAKNAGVPVVLDVDFRSMSWRSPAEAGLAIRLALPFVDVLIANPLELKLATAEDDFEKGVQKVMRAGVPLLLAKLGESGTRAITATETVYLPPYKVDVCTTIGAGDGFASGFLYGRLQNKSLTDCLHYGNATAAIVVSRLCCSEAMPTLPEVEALIAEQKATCVPA